MHSPSSAFRTAVYSGAAQKLIITFSDGVLTESEVTSFAVEEAVNPDTDLTIGAVNSRHFSGSVRERLFSR